MTEEQIIIEVCKIMGIPYSHYDNHKMCVDYFQYTLESIPKIVVYGGRYGPWELAILEDMSVITPLSRFHKTLIECAEVIATTDNSKIVKDTLNKITKIKRAEIFLKENNCAEVINNPDKKINWV